MDGRISSGSSLSHDRLAKHIILIIIIIIPTPKHKGKGILPLLSKASWAKTL